MMLIFGPPYRDTIQLWNTLADELRAMGYLEQARENHTLSVTELTAAFRSLHTDYLAAELRAEGTLDEDYHDEPEPRDGEEW